MTWSTAIADLRTNISDGPTDRYRYRTQVFGQINGTNAVFKTFELRRATDFTVTQGIYKNGNLLALVAVSADNLNTGEFTLVGGSIPVDGDILEASFYLQWFLDSELNLFLTNASRWLGLGATYSNMGDGLIPACLKYAESEAYLKLAQRWRDYLSQGYRVEDSPQKDGTSPVDSYIKMSQVYRKQAQDDRDQFYKRQGQPLAPLFGSVLGNIQSMPK